MVTRLGLYGGSRGLYGSFAGKTEQEPVTLVLHTGLTKNVGKSLGTG